jgi:hypothetical protein
MAIAIDRVDGWTVMKVASRRKRSRALWALASILAAGACSRAGEAPPPPEPPARELVERFAAFDDWARRAFRGDHLFASDAAFREALFAPVRREDDVLDACVERRATVPRTWCLHGAPPPIEGEWTNVRNAPRSGVRVIGGTDAWSFERGAREEGIEVRVTMVLTRPR